MSEAGRLTQNGIIGAVLALSAGLMAMDGALAAPSAVAPSLPPALSSASLTYADYADLVLNAPVVAVVQIGKSERLKGDLAPGLVADRARFLIEAEVQTLLKGSGGLPGAVSYIADIPMGAKGKVPALKRRRALLIADRVPSRPLELRLNSPYSQLDWTQETESRVRAILQEASAASAPPIITGVGNAFYVPGAIPGESEAQIFLTTSDNRPISLSILRRPGEQPQWAVALGEMVDDSAKLPERETLLWYRLACFLPAKLPGKSVAALSSADGDAVRRDYQLVIDKLGPCTRTIKRS